MLASSPFSSRLQFLGLEHCEIGAKGAKALANASHFHQLETLSISPDNIHKKGVQAIVESEHLPQCIREAFRKNLK